MYQIPLEITPRLLYAANSFVVHQGVKDVVEFCDSQILADDYRICVVYAPVNSGKTHFSVKIADDLQNQGANLILLDGATLDKFLAGQGLGAEYPQHTVVIIDNAERYFANLAPDRSGEFVNLVEALRRSKASLIVLTSQPVTSFPIDDHVRSRLRPGEGFCFGSPLDEEMNLLVATLAKQRGIRLAPKKISYLAKRLERNVASIASSLNALLIKSENGENLDSYKVLASVVN